VITILLVIFDIDAARCGSRVDDTSKASSDLTIHNSLLSVVLPDLLRRRPHCTVSEVRPKNRLIL